MRLSAAEAGVEGPAIKALGARFKVTEVYLWDDFKVRYEEAPSWVDSAVKEPISSSTMVDTNSISSQSTDYDSSMEDLELASQMAALGLPNSFSTTKERNVTPRERRVRAKGQSVDKNVKNGTNRLSEAVELESIALLSIPEDYSNLLLSSNHAEEQHETIIHCEGELSQQKDEKQSNSSSSSCDIFHTNSDIAGQRCISSIESSSCALTDYSIQAYPDNGMLQEFGEWSVIWDNFYRRNYFYNSQTQESTWYPPPGLEYLSSPWSTSVSNDSTTNHVDANASFSFSTDADQGKWTADLKDKLVEIPESRTTAVSLNLSSSDTLATKNSDTHLTSTSVLETLDMLNPIEELSKEPFHLHLSEVQNHTTDHMIENFNGEKVTSHEALSLLDLSEEVSLVYCDTNESKQSGLNGTEGSQASTLDEVKSYHEVVSIKKKRRVKRVQSDPRLQGASGSLSANLEKYWCQRYSLFSQFDNGIKMDEEGWFSVTPEPIARHHAYRCGTGIVIDCFAGVGGNTIQFAIKSNYVISIDIDPLKVEFAQHNAAIYGIGDKIEFILGDFFQMANYLKGDTIFLSPPWGGPDYAKVETYDIRSMLKPHDGYYLFKVAITIAPRVVFYLPRNVDINQLAELTLSLDPTWTVEVEKNILNGKFKAVTAYFTCMT